ncbi:MAG TPA: aminoglycoside phosphotransferase family protein [Streptosporangiaceae bacterium]|nr:aminoglycoside phosphotransferase family protein [Streptosporangiaceae bacterium]
MTEPSAPPPHGDAPPTAATLRWIVGCLGPGSRVRQIRPLPGGVSHVNHALLVETRSGIVHRLVLRRWARPGPTIADLEFPPEREIAALALLARCEVTTPALVAADPSGAYCDAPALLITRLVGHPPRPGPDDLPEHLIQLAAALLSIHAVSGATTMPPYAPHNQLHVRVPPRHALRPALWAQAFEVGAGPAPADGESRFIHRDYHPGNTLWSYGRLSGVVDWSTASYGPPAVDVADMRWQLAVRYGTEIADGFLTAVHQVCGDHEHDPYWDVRAVLDLLPEHGDWTISEPHIPLLEDHLARALSRLGSVAR